MGRSQDMRSSLLARLAKGVGAQGFAQAVNTFIRLVELPLFLHFWDTQLYGEWLLLTAIPSYLTVGDLGFTSTAQRDMTMRIGAGNRQGVLAVFQSTWLLILLLSCFAGLAVALLVSVTPLPRWLHLEAISPNQVRAVLLLLTVQVLISLQIGLVSGGLYCEGRYGFATFLQSLVKLLEIGALGLIVAMGGGPVQAACSLLGSHLAGLVLMRFTLLHTASWLQYGWGSASFGEIRRLAPAACASMAFPLGNALNIQGMRLVVGAVLGPTAVVQFSTLRTLSRMGLQVLQSVNRVVQPELGLAFGAGDQVMFRALFRRSCQAALWGCLAVCVLLWLAGDSLLEIWARGKVTMNWGLYALLLSTAAVNAFWYAALTVPYATNRHISVAAMYVAVYGGAVFGLAYGGAKLWGLEGVGMALLVGEVAMVAYVIHISLHLSMDSWSQWLKTISQPPWFVVRYLWRGGVH
jgi:O-antigen/teichoic acid export membrane protein